MIRILFVCTGNTCRSPMAEAILKNKNIPGVEVRSAGVHASPGQGASMHAKNILVENDILHTHQSNPLTKAEMEWATHIFTMTQGHKTVIIRGFPDLIDKTFTLKEFVLDDTYDRDIIDPFGGSEGIYRETFKELQDLIEKLVMKLKG
ncbi:low molecular weight protein arginine phosphatase [Peribacillus sp. SI8-4]|uniref:low molecular weight protein arginine phosphatase n=1 Tax=Peribacillus sp. SI8-4 TaxID=3048009 RepID=UPI00255411CF|nr:low molecular weight protein arginine phosphatase [Peribacillus sp. SI8-4]